MGGFDWLCPIYLIVCLLSVKGIKCVYPDHMPVDNILPNAQGIFALLSVHVRLSKAIAAGSELFCQKCRCDPMSLQLYDIEKPDSYPG